MFQYAAALAFAKNNNSELVLDYINGFAFDFQFRRKFELINLPIRGFRKINLKENLLYWIFRLEKRMNAWQPVKKIKNITFAKKNDILFVFEENNKFCSLIKNFGSCNVWLNGYFQSPDYFKTITDTILNHFKLPEPKNKKICDIGNRLEQNQIIALSLRFYEETANPSLQGLNGKVKTISDFQLAIKKMCTLVPRAKFAVFCTHRSHLLKELVIPNNPIFITPEDGYQDAFTSLWLLSKCKHHIFNNSTFYWWGAWFSYMNYKKSQGTQNILISDNFLNKRIYLKGWKKF